MTMMHLRHVQEEMEDEVIPKLQQLLTEEIPLQHGRTLAIPYDCQTGWNKGKYDPNKNQTIKGL